MKANRAQLEWRPVDLEGLLPADHRARSWAFVEGLELRPLYEEIRSVEGVAGHPAIDPAILVTLWLYATLEGVGSARASPKSGDKDFEQVVLVLSGHEAFVGDAEFFSLFPPKQDERHAAQAGEIFGAMAFVDAASLFAEAHVQQPVQLVFDVPRVSDQLCDGGGIGAVEAADEGAALAGGLRERMPQAI